MSNYKEKLAKLHNDITKKGWIKTHRQETGGIGRTYENLLCIKENNKSEPDFGDIEIKTHRDNSKNIHLFGKTPSSIPDAIFYLANEYGDYKTKKKFNCSIKSNKYTPCKNDTCFKLLNNYKEKRLYICVYDDRHNLIDDSVYYTHDEISNIFHKKLKNLFFVTAQCQKNDDKEEEFRYYKEATLYTNPSFDVFLKMIDSGEISCDIMLGIYTHGIKNGKPRDHGTRFGIAEDKITKLYLSEECIKDGEIHTIRGNEYYDKNDEIVLYELF